jgi:hypothetical protein
VSAPDRPLHSKEERLDLKRRNGKKQENVMTAVLDGHRNRATSNPEAHQSLLDVLLPAAAIS